MGQAACGARVHDLMVGCDVFGRICWVEYEAGRSWKALYPCIGCGVGVGGSLVGQAFLEGYWEEGVTGGRLGISVFE